ncbi:MAG TPA: phytanoyl-CoA dioxygenase family protein [Cytophagaceae bacterium]
MKEYINNNGYGIANNIYSKSEVVSLINIIQSKESKSNSNFRRTKDLYAIRNLLQEIPEVLEMVLNPALKILLSNYFGDAYFPVKGIYFDKPPLSTWFVNWHQDLTISVDRKDDIPGFSNWTLKEGYQAVKPSVEYLEDILTARIHLDDTDKHNGALHVIAGSHTKGIIEDKEIQLIRKNQSSKVCSVNAGGVMFMKPLLLHASYKSINDNHRRVLHIEFASKELPNGLKWRERPS